MEPLPSPQHRAATAVPKLHLLPHSHADNNGSASLRSLLNPKMDSPRAPSTCPTSSTCLRPHELLHAPPLSAMERVSSPRVYTSTINYLDSSHTALSPTRGHLPLAKPRPPSTPRQPNNHPRDTEPLSQAFSLRDEFLVLHPSLDLTDENGELSQLLLSKWSLNSGEQAFASISLFCEMKLNEAKRMTSWVERPNRFFTTVCCQLLDKYVQRLEAQRHSPESGASAAFLRKLHEELVASVFMDTSIHNVPFFLEYKKLKRHAQLLMATVQNRAQTAATKEKLPLRIEKLLASHQHKSDKRLLGMLFHAWRSTSRHENATRTLKCKAFRASRKLNLSALFRAWRIEALRRAYQRESVEYQTMLSITAASLSRKDVQIADADSKMASMAKIIDSLTESNAQLLYRVEQLEAIASGKGGAALLALHGSHGDSGGMMSFHRSPGAQYDHLDSLTSTSGTGAGGNGNGIGGNDDEKMDRTNRMLLETMFGMARMVESCAIQMSKDMMDSLEQQLDGSLLQQLSEMIHADNVAKLQADDARGLYYGASPPSTPASSSSSSGFVHRKISAAYAATGTNSTMVASLGKGVVAIKDLAQMPVDAFLLCWFRMNLQLSSTAEKSSDRTIKNFTTDLVDGRRFSFLLHRLSPTWFDSNMVHEIDTDERLQNIASFHSRVQPELPQVLTSDSIHSGSATENVAFTAMLFGLSVQNIRRINLDRQREKFLNIITSWKRVRSLLLEVKRMNDNYDSLMVVHLLKEMRTCETLFKQLNAELCSIAIASNESSSTLSQIAYKVLHLTWRCLHAKSSAGGIASLELVDDRLAEKVKDFSQLEVSTVRQLLVNDAQYETRAVTTSKKMTSAMAAMTLAMSPQAIPEKDVLTRTDVVRETLAMYCKDLHDIFKHYSASGGVGSIASMSLSEFNKFLKDCALLAVDGGPPLPTPPAAHSSKSSSHHPPQASSSVALTPHMLEFIFKAALFFSPLTPREFAFTAMATTTTTITTGGASSTGTGDPGSSATAASETAAAAAAQQGISNMVLPSADPFRLDPAIMSLDFGEREMAGGEFVDALFRIAAIKCPAVVNGNSPLDERFRDFMEHHVLPNALRSQSEIFRAEVASPKVRAVFQKHKPALQRIFRYYTAMHALREQQSTMDLKEFAIFAKDCKLIGTFVTEHTLKQVLVNLQRDDVANELLNNSNSGSGGKAGRAAAAVGAPGGNDDAKLLRVDFADFQEAIAALTEYVICNPYVPLYKRIEQFINENVLPRARQKKKAVGE